VIPVAHPSSQGFPILQLGEAYQAQSAGPEERAEIENLFHTSIVAFRIRARQLDVEPHTGGFSLKTVFQGTEHYEFENQRIAVSPNEILMVAPGQLYGSSIRSSAFTDSFSLFFPDPWLAQTAKDNDCCLIDTLVNGRVPALGLSAQAGLSRALRGLAEILNDRSDPLLAQQYLAKVVHLALAIGTEVGPALERIAVNQPARRAELLRRALKARDRLQASLSDEVSLAELAALANISQFHLVRIFRQAFGETPAHYRRRLRMEQAFELVTGTDQPIADIGEQCGYRDASALARAFRRHTGKSAGAIRRAHSRRVFASARLPPA